MSVADGDEEHSEKWDEQGLQIGETVPHKKDDAAPHC